VKAPSNHACSLRFISWFWSWQQHNRHYSAQRRRRRPHHESRQVAAAKQSIPRTTQCRHHHLFVHSHVCVNTYSNNSLIIYARIQRIFLLQSEKKNVSISILTCGTTIARFRTPNDKPELTKIN